jgi:DNA polymerase
MYSVTIDQADAFNAFRHVARGLIAAAVAPKEVDWRDGDEPAMFAAPPAVNGPPLSVPPAFADLARDVVCHSDGERFGLLYTCLWRQQHGEKALLADAADPLVHHLMQMAKSVRRDLHKMTAFVRFRSVQADGGGDEHFIAWFEPAHHILRRAGPFFRDRFAAMRWTILTPEGSIDWNGEGLRYGPPVNRSDAPTADSLDDWWLTYYRATFNPARANPEAMRAEMPKKYWRNLPEASIIPDLLDSSQHRTEAMIRAHPTAARRAKSPAALQDKPLPAGSLAKLAKQAADCERCPLFANATQTVFGEGPRHAPVVFVGEQPGDQEDLAGHPFVGPAGQVFDRALAEAGIARKEVYVTNAVKHFKFEPRGKRRLHKKPNHSEIEICRWWLDQELGLIKPAVTVALGATAARALMGRDVTISRERGHLVDLRDDLRGFVTVHPSFLLRLPDADAKAAEFRRFVSDLRKVAAEVPAIRAAA